MLKLKLVSDKAIKLIEAMVMGSDLNQIILSLRFHTPCSHTIIENTDNTKSITIFLFAQVFLVKFSYFVLLPQIF